MELFIVLAALVCGVVSISVEPFVCNVNSTVIDSKHEILDVSCPDTTRARLEKVKVATLPARIYQKNTRKYYTYIHPMKCVVTRCIKTDAREILPWVLVWSVFTIGKGTEQRVKREHVPADNMLLIYDRELWANVYIDSEDKTSALYGFPTKRSQIEFKWDNGIYTYGSMDCSDTYVEHKYSYIDANGYVKWGRVRESHSLFCDIHPELVTVQYGKFQGPARYPAVVSPFLNSETCMYAKGSCIYNSYTIVRWELNREAASHVELIGDEFNVTLLRTDTLPNKYMVFVEDLYISGYIEVEDAYREGSLYDLGRGLYYIQFRYSRRKRDVQVLNNESVRKWHQIIEIQQYFADVKVIEKDSLINKLCRFHKTNMEYYRFLCSKSPTVCAQNYLKMDSVRASYKYGMLYVQKCNPVLNVTIVNEFLMTPLQTVTYIYKNMNRTGYYDSDTGEIHVEVPERAWMNPLVNETYNVKYVVLYGKFYTIKRNNTEVYVTEENVTDVITVKQNMPSFQRVRVSDYHSKLGTFAVNELHYGYYVHKTPTYKDVSENSLGDLLAGLVNGVSDFFGSLIGGVSDIWKTIWLVIWIVIGVLIISTLIKCMRMLFGKC